MASTFPGAIDNFTDPLSNSSLSSPSHAGQHSDLNDAVEKIETYMGLVKVIPTSVTSTGGTAATLSATGTVSVGAGNTAVTINGAFSSLYDSYKIISSGGAASGSANILMRLGANTTNYYSAITGVNSAGAAVVGRRQNSQTAMDWVGYATIYSLPIDLTIVNPFLARLTYATSSLIIPTGDMYTSMNYVDDIVSYSSFTLLLSSGTFTSGSIRVYGYRN